MFKRASAIFAFVLAAVVAGVLLAPQQSAVSQTTATFVLKGQSSHPAASNFHLIFKLWAER